MILKIGNQEFKCHTQEERERAFRDTLVPHCKVCGVILSPSEYATSQALGGRYFGLCWVCQDEADKK